MLVAFDVIYVKEPFLTYYVNLLWHRHGGPVFLLHFFGLHSFSGFRWFFKNSSDNMNSEVELL